MAKREVAFIHAFYKTLTNTITLYRKTNTAMFNFENLIDFNAVSQIINDFLTFPKNTNLETAIIPYHPYILMQIENYIRCMRDEDRVIILKETVKTICQRHLTKYYEHDIYFNYNPVATTEQINMEKVQLVNWLAFNKLERAVTQALLLKHSEVERIRTLAEAESKSSGSTITVVNELPIKDFSNKITNVPCRLFPEPIFEDRYINNINNNGFTNNSILFQKEQSVVFQNSFVRKQQYSTQHKRNEKEIHVVDKQGLAVSETAMTPYIIRIKQLVVQKSINSKVLKKLLKRMKRETGLNSLLSSCNDITKRPKVFEINTKTFDCLNNKFERAYLVETYVPKALQIRELSEVSTTTKSLIPFSKINTLTLIDKNITHDLMIIPPEDKALIYKTREKTELIIGFDKKLFLKTTNELNTKNQLINKIEEKVGIIKIEKNKLIQKEETVNKIGKCKFMNQKEEKALANQMNEIIDKEEDINLLTQTKGPTEMEKEMIKKGILDALNSLHFYLKLSTMVPLELFIPLPKKNKTQLTKKAALTLLNNFKLTLNTIVQALFCSSYTSLFSSLEDYLRQLKSQKEFITNIPIIKDSPLDTTKVPEIPTSVRETRIDSIFLTNEIPLNFRKKLLVPPILPKTTFWNCYPKMPTVYNIKSNGSKRPKRVNRKYKYETKEIEACNGNIVKITCLIPMG